MTRARHAAASLVLSVLGLLMLIASAGYGIYQISDLRGQIEEQEEQLSTRRIEADALEQKVRTIRDSSIQELIKEGLVEAKAIAVPTDRTTVVEGTTLPLYNFIVWLDMPYARKADVQEVKYEFPHGSFLNKNQSSSEASNGFAVGYLGWGAMPSVPITIVSRDASAENGTIDFPMGSRTRIITEPEN